MTAVVSQGALQHLSLDGRDAVAAIYVRVRDEYWRSVPPRWLRHETTRTGTTFDVRLAAEHVSGDIDFAWEGFIRGDSSGRISYAIDGVARRDFMKNRIGLCVLHPGSIAGTSYRATGPTETVLSIFPVLVQPGVIATDLTGLEYVVDGSTTVRLFLDGDLFETEDQRQWTDATFKTYSTPLRLPRPSAIAAGTRISQQITIELAGPRPRRARLAARRDPAVRVDAVGSPIAAPGIGLAHDGRPLSGRARSRLRSLGAAFLFLEVDLAEPRWEERLGAAALDAAALGWPLDIRATTADHGAAVRRLALATARPPVRSVCLVDDERALTTSELVRAFQRAVGRDGQCPKLLAGGNRDFAEVNRGALPLDLVDGISFPTCPQEHDVDDWSVMTSRDGLAAAVRTAGVRSLGLPVHIAPISLVSQPRDGSPPAPDARSGALFGAAWTVGNLQALAAEGAATAAVGGVAGPYGIVTPEGRGVAPMFHVIADFLSGRSLLPVTVDDERLSAVGVSTGGRGRVLVANRTTKPVQGRLLLAAPARLVVRTLDEHTVDLASASPSEFRRSSAQPMTSVARAFPFTLGPYAIATLMVSTGRTATTAGPSRGAAGDTFHG